MTTTATHNDRDTTPERALFVAFALREKTWKLGFTTSHGQQPRERGVAPGNRAHVLQDVAQAKRRCGLPETASSRTVELYVDGALDDLLG